MKNFNERLKELREEHNLTQTELAKQLLVDQRSLSFYELGKFEPNIDTIKRIAIYFNVSVDYLLGLTEERKCYSRTKNNNTF